MPPSYPTPLPDSPPRPQARRSGTAPRGDAVTGILTTLRERLTEAALHRFDVALAVRMVADALEESGLAPSRISLAVLSLHPSLAGVGFTWRQGSAEVTRTERPWGFLQSPEHKASPLQAVMTSRAPLHLRLWNGEGVTDFPILREFAEKGLTDYAAFPLFSPRADVHVFTMATDRTGGWSDEELHRIEEVMPTLALLIEVFEAHRLTTRERLDLVDKAQTDRLTRILNRHGILLEGENRFGPGRPCIACYLDLDGFKGVNDRMGHLFGDRILQATAERIGACLPEGALAGRMGGDEFLVLADAVHTDLPERLRERLSEVHTINDLRFTVPASVGAAICPEVSIEELSRRADLALLTSKRGGKNRASFYAPDTDARHRRSEALARELPFAIARGELRVMVQPIVCFESGRVVRGECLVRWHSPEFGEVPPEEFIPLAEQAGEIALIDRIVMRAAIDLLRRDESAPTRTVPLAVNVSAKEVSLHNLEVDLAAELTASRIDSRQLVIELTETVYLAPGGAAAQRFDRLREQGVSIALDDFGSGFASIACLQWIRFDYVKLDRGLISALPDERTVSIVASILALAHSLKATVVAQGVETHEQQAVLQALGCPFGQGYFFSEPLGLDEWRALLDADAALLAQPPASGTVALARADAAAIPR